MQRVLCSFLLIASLSLAALLPSTAFAALGGDASSVKRDQARMRAQIRATPSNDYSVHELQTESGVAVREYVSAQGKVFAVVWSGPSLPDLQQLLGTYFPAFSAAMAERRQSGRRGGPVTLRQSDLVVESHGRMRAYSGRAYVPSLLPPQVTIEEIQ